MVTKTQVLKVWKEKVCKNGSVINDSFLYRADWHSLFIGLAIGMGMSLEEATDYSFYTNEALPLEAE
jgi:hypothetical protein